MKRCVCSQRDLASSSRVSCCSQAAAQGQAGEQRLRLSLVGIAVSDYQKSQAFYERVMGFPVASSLTPDGTRTNTFFPD
jgi:catechol-2,3-dioxygenase